MVTAFDVIHDQVQSYKVVKGVYNALRNKEGGPRGFRRKNLRIETQSTISWQQDARYNLQGIREDDRDDRMSDR